MYSSADAIAQRASDERATSKSPERLAYEGRAYAVSKLAKEIVRLTALGTHWADNSERLFSVSDLVTDMERELVELRKGVA